MLYGYLKNSNHSYHNTTYEKGCFCSLSIVIIKLQLKADSWPHEHRAGRI